MQVSSHVLPWSNNNYDNFTIVQYMKHLPLHFFPVKPFLQIHSKVSPILTQDPPLWQGFVKQTPPRMNESIISFTSLFQSSFLSYSHLHRRSLGCDVKKRSALLRYKTHKYARTRVESGSLNYTL